MGIGVAQAVEVIPVGHPHPGKYSGLSTKQVGMGTGVGVGLET